MKKEETTHGRLWRIDTLLISNLVPAAITFLSQLLLAHSVGLKVFGLWLFYRSACMLATSYWPGLYTGFVYLLPSAYAKGEYARIRSIQRVGDITTFIGLAIGTALTFFVARYYIESWTTVVMVTAYWVGVYIMGHSSSLAQGKSDGAAMLRGGLVESVIGLAGFYFAFKGNLDMFIGVQALRGVARSIVQYRRAPSAKDDTPVSDKQTLRELVRTSIPLSLRGCVQTTSQYGDRFIIKLLFGEIAVGLTGLGSNLAVPVVMACSASAAWLLPVLLRGESKDYSNRTLDTMKKLLGLFVICALLLPIMPLIVKSAQDIESIVYAFSTLALLNFITPALMPIAAQGGLWKSTIAQAVAILLVMGTLFLGNSIGLGVGHSLLLCVPVLIIVLLIVLRLGNVLRYSYPVKISIAIVSFVAIVAYGRILQLGVGSVPLAAGCALAAAVFGYFQARGYIGRMAQKLRRPSPQVSPG